MSSCSLLSLVVTGMMGSTRYPEFRRPRSRNNSNSRPVPVPVFVLTPPHFLLSVLPGEVIPLDRHNTLTSFAADEFVIPTNVGPKNITSSSGWAITKRMFLSRIGLDFVRFKACILQVIQLRIKAYHDTENATTTKERM